VEKQIEDFLRNQGKEPAATSGILREMNAKAWAASIILVIPVFAMVYYLSKDLVDHERRQEAFLASAFPQRMFMVQTIPIKKYALITIVTLGVGGIYWLYKITNNYNAHFEAQLKIEQEITRLMEETKLESPCKKKRFVRRRLGLQQEIQHTTGKSLGFQRTHQFSGTRTQSSRSRQRIRHTHKVLS
jgi:hypothetical protein